MFGSYLFVEYSKVFLLVFISESSRYTFTKYAHIAFQAVLEPLLNWLMY